MKLLNEYIKSINVDKLKFKTKCIIHKYNYISTKYQSCNLDYLIDKIDLDMLKKLLKCMEKGYGDESYIQQLNDEEVAVVLLGMLDFLNIQYSNKKIAEEIFYNTISDLIFRINDYKKRNGKFGLEPFEGKWLLRIFYLRIFKLGTIQFEMGKMNSEELGIDVKKLEKLEQILNEDVIMVHIMENEDISYEACKYSFEMSDKFFSSKYKYYTCYSWLLYDNMKKILKPSSNILKFQNLFEITINIDDPEMAKERVFKNYDTKNETSLQQNMKIHPECMGIGLGIINRKALIKNFNK